MKKLNIKFSFKDFINYSLVLALLIYGMVLLNTGALRSSTATLLAQMGYSIILAVSLNFVVGFLGELSLGHAGFMCIGAYVGGLSSIYIKDYFIASGVTGDVKLPVIIIGMLIGGAVAAIFGFIIGLPSLRLKGDYLAIVTLAFGEIVRTIFRNQDIFGGAKGLTTGSLTYDTRRAPTLFIVTFIHHVKFTDQNIVLIQNKNINPLVLNIMCTFRYHLFHIVILK